MKNSKIQTVHIENFPIFCARFNTDGSAVILSSRHKSFYEFDMMSGDLHTVHPIKGRTVVAMLVSDKLFFLFVGGLVLCFYGIMLFAFLSN